MHHQTQGLRFNYSQPFFVHFDTILGTRVDPADFHAMLVKKGIKKADDEKAPPPSPSTSPYTTATVWSSVLFAGILVVPVVAYSLM